MKWNVFESETQYTQVETCWKDEKFLSLIFNTMTLKLPICCQLNDEVSSGHAIALWKKQESEKVDHLAYKYWCVLQGSGIIKMVRNLAQSW